MCSAGVDLAFQLGMRARRRFSVMSMSLLAAFWLPAFAAPSPGPPSTRLFDLTTAHGIVDERPFEPSRVFVPDDDVIVLWYAADGCTIGTTIRSTWLYLETDPPSRLTEGSVVVDREGDWGQFNFKLAPGRRWPLGRYRIELRIGDTLMADTEFAVVSVRPTVLEALGISHLNELAHPGRRIDPAGMRTVP
jgi:hypothetical protein